MIHDEERELLIATFDREKALKLLKKAPEMNESWKAPSVCSRPVLPLWIIRINPLQPLRSLRPSPLRLEQQDKGIEDLARWFGRVLPLKRVRDRSLSACERPQERSRSHPPPPIDFYHGHASSKMASKPLRIQEHTPNMANMTSFIIVSDVWALIL